MSLTRPPKSSLTDHVLEQLRLAISRGDWAVGDRIPTEDQLVIELGVSRNTVREAVRVLAHSGMLETRQGAGTYVMTRSDPVLLLQQLDYATLAEWLEVRYILESQAAELAAERRTDADLQQIAECLSIRGDWLPEQAEITLPAFVERDADFHMAVMQASHNHALLAMYRFFSAQWTRTIVHTQRDQSLPTPTTQQHHDLHDAIRDGRPAAATKAVQAMLSPALAAARQQEKDHASTR